MPSFSFKPALTADLTKPMRVITCIPVGLLSRFDPNLTPTSLPADVPKRFGEKLTQEDFDQLNKLWKMVNPVVRNIAKAVSVTLFGPHGDDEPWSCSVPASYSVEHHPRDNSVESVTVEIQHKVDRPGLDPEILYLDATTEVEGNVVFKTRLESGERRRLQNLDNDDWRFHLNEPPKPSL